MLRLAFIALILFFLLSYGLFAYMKYKSRTSGATYRLSPQRMNLILALQFLVILAFLLFLTQGDTAPAGTPYAPPKISDGKIVPPSFSPPAGKDAP